MLRIDLAGADFGIRLLFPRSGRLDRLIPACRPPPNDAEKAEVEKYHAARRNQELAGEEDLQGVHRDQGEGLHGGVQTAAVSAENPATEQDLQSADRDDCRIRNRFSENFPDDHFVPWDAVEDFAVEPVENPNSRDEYGGEAMEWGEFQAGLQKRGWWGKLQDFWLISLRKVVVESTVRQNEFCQGGTDSYVGEL